MTWLLFIGDICPEHKKVAMIIILFRMKLHFGKNLTDEFQEKKSTEYLAYCLKYK